jgi:glycosyltransferase involved in cell wall biosynthesis
MFELLDDTVFKLLIVSKTTKKELDLKNELKQIKNLKIIEEYLPNIYDYYNASDIYFFPTADEKAAIQIPLSIIEAYSCGIKILTTRFGGLELIFPAQNNEGIVYTNLMDISDKLDHIKKLKFKRNIEKFNFSNISKDLVSIYKKVLDK